MSLYVCMCACVFAPLHRCSALLAEGSGGELSLFKQMERDTPGLRKTQRTGNCRAGCLKHTHMQNTNSHFTCYWASGGRHSSAQKYHLGNATQLDIIHLFGDPQSSIKAECDGWKTWIFMHNSTSDAPLGPDKTSAISLNLWHYTYNSDLQLFNRYTGVTHRQCVFHLGLTLTRYHDRLCNTYTTLYGICTQMAHKHLHADKTKWTCHV